jgi:hypothetical protein
MIIRKIESVSHPELAETYLDPFIPIFVIGQTMLLLSCGHEVPANCECVDRLGCAGCEKCTLLHEEIEELRKSIGQGQRDFWI